MPALAFIVLAGSVLVALLFFADATLKDATRKKNSPALLISQRYDLPKPPRDRDGIQILTSAPAPAPDMASRAVRDAQPRREPEALAKIPPKARAARAEATPKDMRVTKPIDYQQNQYQQNQLIDRFSIKGF
jgi:hypothetical protein